MTFEAIVVDPGPRDRTVRMPSGKVVAAPKHWELLPPGDATLTRRVKARSDSWTVKQRRGRRTFSLGVWADAKVINDVRKELAEERSTETYAKQRQAAKIRRDRKQSAYVDEFREQIVSFLDFDPRHRELANSIAVAVARQATPIGSGTVARTERIPIEQRVESAVIAWMRHQTTAYDQMKIPRIKGRRREVRRLLADQSRQLLEDYRQGRPTPKDCPLAQALKNPNDGGK